MTIVIAMKKTKKRGRPPTGARPMIGFRADPALTKRIDHWAKRQPDKHLPRGEAIRRLLTYALDRKEAEEDC
jgi:hypothetical protein